MRMEVVDMKQNGSSESELCSEKNVIKDAVLKRLLNVWNSSSRTNSCCEPYTQYSIWRNRNNIVLDDEAESVSSIDTENYISSSDDDVHSDNCTDASSDNDATEACNNGREEGELLSNAEDDGEDECSISNFEAGDLRKQLEELKNDKKDVKSKILKLKEVAKEQQDRKIKLRLIKDRKKLEDRFIRILVRMVGISTRLRLEPSKAADERKDDEKNSSKDDNKMTAKKRMSHRNHLNHHHHHFRRRRHMSSSSYSPSSSSSTSCVDSPSSPTMNRRAQKAYFKQPHKDQHSRSIENSDAFKADVNAKMRDENNLDSPLSPKQKPFTNSNMNLVQASMSSRPTISFNLPNVGEKKENAVVPPTILPAEYATLKFPYPVINDRRDLNVIAKILRSKKKEVELRLNETIFQLNNREEDNDDTLSKLRKSADALRAQMRRMDTQFDYVQTRQEIERLKVTPCRTQKEKEEAKRQITLLIQRMGRLHSHMKEANRRFLKAHLKEKEITDSTINSITTSPTVGFCLSPGHELISSYPPLPSSSGEISTSSSPQVLKRSPTPVKTDQASNVTSMLLPKKRNASKSSSENCIKPAKTLRKTDSSLSVIKTKITELIHGKAPTEKTESVKPRSHSSSSEEEGQVQREVKKNKRNRKKNKNQQLQEISKSKCKENYMVMLEQDAELKRRVATEIQSSVMSDPVLSQNPIMKALTAEAQKRLGFEPVSKSSNENGQENTSNPVIQSEMDNDIATDKTGADSNRMLQSTINADAACDNKENIAYEKDNESTDDSLSEYSDDGGDVDLHFIFKSQECGGLKFTSSEILPFQKNCLFRDNNTTHDVNFIFSGTDLSSLGSAVDCVKYQNLIKECNYVFIGRQLRNPVTASASLHSLLF